jgi:FAD/FMN-containing dehydrogenase
MSALSISNSAVQTTVDFSSLSDQLRGDLILPTSPGYDTARAVWNLVHDRRPAAIAQVADAQDVQHAVRFARTTGLEVAVRAGGHSMAGFSTGDDVLVIDVRNLRRLDVDADSGMVHAGAGLTAGMVTAELAKHGLAVPFGDTASTGIAGLTLGGGVGYLARKFGLAIDRVRAMEVVTASGDIVVASSEEHPDLFWALRGGGGNFGVVTRFSYEAIRVPETLSGALVLPLTADVLGRVLAIAEAAPDELSTIVDIMPAPPAPFIPAERVGTPIVFLTLVYAGDPAQGQAVVDRFRAIATPIADLVSPMPYGGIFQFTADAEVPGPAAVRSMYTDALDEATIHRIIERVSAPDRAVFSVTQLRVLGGQVSRVAPEETAFSHRNAELMFTIYALLTEPDRMAEDRQWLTEYFDAVSPLGKGVYVNFLEVEGDARVRAAYGEATYRRLVEIKGRWDPDNLFRRNHNITAA